MAVRNAVVHNNLAETARTTIRAWLWAEGDCVKQNNASASTNCLADHCALIQIDSYETAPAACFWSSYTHKANPKIHKMSTELTATNMRCQKMTVRQKDIDAVRHRWALK